MDLWVGCHKTTLLSLACEYEQEKIVNAIISEQTELRINWQDEIGKTPLMEKEKKGLNNREIIDGMHSTRSYFLDRNLDVVVVKFSSS